MIIDSHANSDKIYMQKTGHSYFRDDDEDDEDDHVGDD